MASSNDSLLNIAKEFLLSVSKQLDPYTTRKGEIKIEGSSVILLTPSHIQWARYGRGPGKRPPLDPILDWVKREGIIFENATAEGTAFAIMNSISNKGTKNYVSGAPNALEEAINNDLENYNKQINDEFAKGVDEEVQAIYAEMELFQPIHKVKL